MKKNNKNNIIIITLIVIILAATAITLLKNKKISEDRVAKVVESKEILKENYKGNSTKENLVKTQEWSGVFEANKETKLSSEIPGKIEKINIETTIKIFPKDLKILADPDLIDQVLINLLLNAIDAVSGKRTDNTKPKITIVASVNLNNRTTIEVADNGKGIKPDLLDKIFMPFFTSKSLGSGIGLSLSRQIMQMHKGSISVRSKQDEGAIFTMVF